MYISKKIIYVLIIAIMVSSLVYIGYRAYKVHKNVNSLKTKIGYRNSCGYLSNKKFWLGDWQCILIDADISYTDGSHNIIPYDIDNDGKVELIANSYRSDALIIYKYNRDPYDISNWSRFVVDSSVGGGIPRRPLFNFIKDIIKERLLGAFRGGAHYTAIIDMNDDGRDDLVVAGDLKRNDIVWYEVPEDVTKLSFFKKHIVYRNIKHRTYHIEVGNIDDDGYPDIVFVTKTDNSIGWLKNNRSLSEWPSTWIDKSCIRCFNARIADIDKDGQNDIVASEDDSIRGGKLHLYNYSGNPAIENNWTDHIIAYFPTGQGVSIFEITDIDNDGDLDIVAGNHQGDVYIMVNPYPKEVLSIWKKFKITSNSLSLGHDFREIDVGDIDNDGYYDVIVADEGQNMIIWFKNPGNNYYENWLPHIIDYSDKYLKWCHSVELGDIDGDGFLDVAVAAASSNVFLCYFNEMMIEKEKTSAQDLKLGIKKISISN